MNMLDINDVLREELGQDISQILKFCPNNQVDISAPASCYEALYSPKILVAIAVAVGLKV